jgi:hypothetical protein
MSVTKVLGAVAHFGLTQCAPAMPLDIRAENVATRTFESLREFALLSHNFSPYYRPCFTANSSTYNWFAGECPSGEAVICEESWQGAPHHFNADAWLLRVESAKTKQEECRDLHKAIIREHVVLALEGNLSDNSAYGAHLAYRCNGPGCVPIGDLAWINTMSTTQRATLAELPITECPVIDSKRTKQNNHFQTLSATIFGSIPTQLKDICSTIFAHRFARNIPDHDGL